MKPTEGELLDIIVKIIEMDGEEATDGEVIEQVYETITKWKEVGW